jgi:uncharacterized protein (TIGR03086 family)
VRQQQVFADADRALAAVVGRIGVGHWSREVPSPMRWKDGIRTLRDLVDHHARDDAWVPDVLAGRAIAEVGDAHDGDLLGADPAVAFARVVETAVAAVQAFDDLDAVVQLSYGGFPAREYLLHVTLFRALGAHDIAVFTGTSTAMTDELAAGLLELVSPHADGLRAMGVFGPELRVPADASARDRFLGLTGRDPAA